MKKTTALFSACILSLFALSNGAEYEKDIVINGVEWDVSSSLNNVNIFIKNPGSIDRVYQYSFTSANIDNAKTFFAEAMTAFTSGLRADIYWTDNIATSTSSTRIAGHFTALKIHQ